MMGADDQPSVEAYGQLRYLLRCVSESMRLYPHPPVLLRRALVPDTLPGAILFVLSCSMLCPIVQQQEVAIFTLETAVASGFSAPICLDHYVLSCSHVLLMLSQISKEESKSFVGFRHQFTLTNMYPHALMLFQIHLVFSCLVKSAKRSLVVQAAMLCHEGRMSSYPSTIFITVLQCGRIRMHSSLKDLRSMRRHPQRLTLATSAHCSVATPCLHSRVSMHTRCCVANELGHSGFREVQHITVGHPDSPLSLSNMLHCPARAANHSEAVIFQVHPIQWGPAQMCGRPVRDHGGSDSFSCSAS